MILSSERISAAVINGDISISPFNKKRLNPNSYNLSLNKKILVYTDVIDSIKDNPTREIIIPEEGFVLEPGELYLGRTNENITTEQHIGQIDGRSSIARLGICIHLTAGLGSIGFSGFWTLEITCVKPVRIYADIEICQMYFHEISGPKANNKFIGLMYSKGKYQNNTDVEASKLHLEISNTKSLYTNNNNKERIEDEKERDNSNSDEREFHIQHQGSGQIIENQSEDKVYKTEEIL